MEKRGYIDPAWTPEVDEQAPPAKQASETDLTALAQDARQRLAETAAQPPHAETK